MKNIITCPQCTTVSPESTAVIDIPILYFGLATHTNYDTSQFESISHTMLTVLWLGLCSSLHEVGFGCQGGSKLEWRPCWDYVRSDFNSLNPGRGDRHFDYIFIFIFMMVENKNGIFEMLFIVFLRILLKSHFFFKNIETGTKWTPFCRRHLHKHLSKYFFSKFQ